MRKRHLLWIVPLSMLVGLVVTWLVFRAISYGFDATCWNLLDETLNAMAECGCRGGYYIPTGGGG